MRFHFGIFPDEGKKLIKNFLLEKSGKPGIGILFSRIEIVMIIDSGA